MSSDTKSFYDDLSADYHLIYNDWDNAIKNQSAILDKVLQEHTKGSGVTLLDCSCGIGTQAIGLAQLGYIVTATDISPAAVERAKAEAAKRNVKIIFGIADFITLDKQVEGAFDIVISCDNSLPHLLNDDELRITAKNILSKLNPDGLFIASIRDYDKILEDKPISTFPVVKKIDDKQIHTFQIWQWAEHNIYNVSHYVIKGSHDHYTTTLREVQYRAYKRDEITAVLNAQGFTGIKWLMPAETGYYQPVVLAYKP